MTETAFSYFRLMDESDLNWVYKIETQSYDFPWKQKSFIRVIDYGLAYILCNSDHQPLGYACFLTVLDEVQLLNLCVARQFRHQQVAFEALKYFGVYFKDSDFRIMQLEVRETNPARKLYEKVGFKEDGLRQGYYPVKASSSVRENAILMTWDL